ncbi:MAG: helix-hairpin-helix domain-containing protein [Candidatus Eremiobacteraeota bacterium]|nr:helix-hairpin-helix domain-containing protein [Candidatus Eremiobacteraeota bacterium]
MTAVRTLVTAVVAIGVLAAAATFRPPRAEPALKPSLPQAPEPTVRSHAAHRHSRKPHRVRHLEPVARIDVNAADAAAFARVPGIGGQLAARIVAFRKIAGRFESLEELTDVDGISPRRLDALSRYLIVR